MKVIDLEFVVPIKILLTFSIGDTNCKSSDTSVLDYIVFGVGVRFSVVGTSALVPGLVPGPRLFTTNPIPVVQAPRMAPRT
jgi:hypothetical protein